MRERAKLGLAMLRASLLMVAAAALTSCGEDREQQHRETVLAMSHELNELRAELLACEARAAVPAAAAEPPPVAAPEVPERVEVALEDAPLAPLRSVVRRNSAGVTELEIVVRSQDARVIDGVRFVGECYDNFNTRIQRRFARGGDDYVRGSSDLTIRPRSERRIGVWSLFDFPGCTKHIATITEVHFTNGETWSGIVRQQEDPREPEAD